MLYLTIGTIIATVNLVLMLIDAHKPGRLSWILIHVIFSALTILLWPGFVMYAMKRARISPMSFFMRGV